jgi:hypothetical protein
MFVEVGMWEEQGDRWLDYWKTGSVMMGENSIQFTLPAKWKKE